MGRGVSSGGGQSSLGYLFGSGEAPKPATTTGTSTVSSTSSELPRAQTEVGKEAPEKPINASPSLGVAKENSAGAPGSKTNNYFRADGQNCGNFLTDRPTTKVHAAPGGGSSLDYLFGGSGK